METIVKDYVPGSSPLILACSPRKGGNSDLAAALMAEGLRSAGAAPDLLHLRDLDISPCKGCQACGESPDFSCVLMHRDQAEEVFGRLIAAPVLFFAAPIYFYHLPAAFKGFIDRSQRYYVAKNAGDPVLNALAKRPAHVFLVGGRSRGERLFEGSLLTMRYFLWPFSAKLGEDFCLHGIDAMDDLRRDRASQERIRQFAARCWENARP